MAEQVVIPAGVNPAAAGGNGPDVTHYGSRANGGSATPGAPGGDGGIPAVPKAAEQKPGFQPTQPPASGGDAEYQQFLAWKAAQAAQAGAAPVVPVTLAAPTKPVANLQAFGGDGIGGDAALAATQAAASSDPIIALTFENMATVAPDLNLARAMGNAIDRADPSLIDRAYLREVGGDKADKLIKLAEGMVNHVTAAVDNMVTTIHAKAGGEAQWNASTASFNQSAPAYLKAYVTEQLNSANPTKIQAGVAAVLDFVKQAGTLPVAPQGHVRAGGGSPDAALGLSKQAYQEARLKLNKFDRGYNDAARELDARRAIGKKLGL